ncbi:FAD-dependent monooxygenase [Roseomonas populi]|uniref:FAD-dependent monooxygenase n=1 Tax=Roseomonas populi TaxID=3121582 RepID=A0ABT1XDG2_9PROT|nr:FAD-dependent monooxygenase [Roseomonas pecuniae]MCR0985009.1 FAD-dependent monooxygenase [Roseomonas pecuniae]
MVHCPDTSPRPSTFYDYRVHPFRAPDELRGGAERHSVAIVGAGPTGLLTAIGLAQHGVHSVVLAQDVQVSHGSRAAVLVRRSMEILQRRGVVDPFAGKGLPWSGGRSFYRGQEVYRMTMPHEEGQRHPPATNVQQQYIEEFLSDVAEREPLIDLRWGSRVTSFEQDGEEARLGVDTPEGAYMLRASYAVAADGGRSDLRRMLGLRMEGRAYSGRFVIADIRIDLPLPTERLCYFDPDWNPGNNVLVHRMPDSLWRIDFRLPDDETPEQALEPELLRQRIELTLRMVGHPLPWTLDWATVYSASALTLPRYVHGRLAFVGDAAHLLPIFGVRGANTGIQDSDNLAWKLAYVLRGLGGPGLLESYSDERVEAVREICEEAGKSTRFMTPPSRGYRLMRDAALSFTLSEAFTKDLLHWRTARPHDYRTSLLNSDPAADAAFTSGPRFGAPVPDIRLADGSHLLDHLGPDFHLICFGDGDTQGMGDLLKAARRSRIPLRVLLLRREGTPPATGYDAQVEDTGSNVADRFGALPGTAYLVRPDGHVCARWLRPEPAALKQALAVACAAQE